MTGTTSGPTPLHFILAAVIRRRTRDEETSTRRAGHGVHTTPTDDESTTFYCDKCDPDARTTTLTDVAKGCTYELALSRQALHSRHPRRTGGRLLRAIAAAA